MNDRALLEAAAKAAGLEFKWREGDAKWGPEHVGPAAFLNECWQPWNPLADDGDNARLRRAARIVVQWFPTDVAAMHWNDQGHGRSWAEMYGDDPAAAERRAVVRAAAAIGSERG